MSTKPLSVLLIEDSEIDQELMTAYLNRAWPFERGLSIQTAVNGIEALEKMRATTFAFIMLDWNLPTGGKGHVLREMRRNGVYIPVVVLSGFDRSDIHADLDALGAVYLCKDDLNVSTLYCAIADALKQVGRFREKPKTEILTAGQLAFHSHAPANTTW